jgi:hypothetical protein
MPTSHVSNSSVQKFACRQHDGLCLQNSVHPGTWILALKLSDEWPMFCSVLSLAPGDLKIIQYLFLSSSRYQLL